MSVGADLEKFAVDSAKADDIAVADVSITFLESDAEEVSRAAVRVADTVPMSADPTPGATRVTPIGTSSRAARIAVLRSPCLAACP